MSKIYNTGEHPLCPHCEKDLDNCPVEDFIVLSHGVGAKTKDTCGSCYKWLKIERIADKQFSVKSA